MATKGKKTKVDSVDQAPEIDGQSVGSEAARESEVSADLDAIMALARASGHKTQEGKGNDVVRALQLEQMDFLDRCSDSFDQEDVIKNNAAKTGYEASVQKLVELLGEDAHCNSVDIKLWCNFCDVYKSEDNQLSSAHFSRNEVKKQMKEIYGFNSELSKDKSVGELESDFKNNLGQKVDGVTVTDRGDKVGVEFDIHPVLLSRIRRVEGAAFNTADKVWEVPKEKQEFALRAAQGMRDEFVLDAKEVGELIKVAESKMDNARVWPAFTKDGQESYGVVLDVGKRYALQKGGRENFTLHHLSQLDRVPVKGHDCAIRYNKGVGTVVDQDLRREQNQARGAGR